MVAIFCTHCQQLHVDPKRRLCHSPQVLGSLTWLCPCQLHTFTQDLTHQAFLCSPTACFGHCLGLACCSTSQSLCSWA